MIRLNLVKTIRFLLLIYRKVLSFCFGRKSYGIMNKGVLCNISKFNFEINKGDVVHPCVKYTNKPFRGYNWWLIYTPYYQSKSDIENPILCYGISDDGQVPVKWQVYVEIIGKPEFGYNSDPNMFFNDKGLNIFWRENDTIRTRNDNLYRATYGCIFTENEKLDFINPILSEKRVYIDREVSPAFIGYNDEYYAFAMHVRFKNPKLNVQSILIDKIFNYILAGASILNIYSQTKSLGISIWKSNTTSNSFKYLKTTKILNCNKLYKPWHLDIFENSNKLYAVIQTSQCNADICLAVSDDYENFTMYSKPLITNLNINKEGIYKPTGFVYKDIFYLFYTAQDKDNRSLNKLYLTSMSFSKLLNEIL